MNYDPTTKQNNNTLLPPASLQQPQGPWGDRNLSISKIMISIILLYYYPYYLTISFY